MSQSHASFGGAIEVPHVLFSKPFTQLTGQNDFRFTPAYFVAFIHKIHLKKNPPTWAGVYFK
ncbi:hypothetical protein CSC17_0399 [Klebsiella oxytoca]|nr:hypothetical protein CSC17_0399 [Klebsiella oxytoca]